MSSSDLERVIAYHDATKHHPNRYARSRGSLDWANQPDPFRRFDGARLVQLDFPDDDSPAYECLYERGAVVPAALTLASLSRLFFRALSISAWKQSSDARWPLRCDPSSGNLHPTEGYAILPAVEDVSQGGGVFHYAACEHALEERAAFDRDTTARLFAGHGEAAVVLGVSSIHWREAWKYGERAFRYCQHDAGHVIAGLRYAAASLGWSTYLLDGPDDADVAALLGFDRDGDFADAERESAECLLAVHVSRDVASCPMTFDADVVRAVRDSQWAGKANRLSKESVDWPIIDDVEAATVKPVCSVPPRPADALESVRSTEVELDAAHRDREGQTSAETIFRQRRSATAFDGRTGMPVGTFARLMRRVTPDAVTPVCPWDAITWRPTIHLLLFVHRVEGLTPGVYALIRDAVGAADNVDARVAAFRRHVKRDFDWTQPTNVVDDVPLWFLHEADCRRSAAQLSLMQDIAGDSAFSLGMLASFDDALREHGPWFYKRLFWEAGMIGQVLYLEAEAVGLRATGIGAYFDDLVHKVPGIDGHGLQSMYHFTVGGPVDDSRLTTLPAYPPPK